METAPNQTEQTLSVGNVSNPEKGEDRRDRDGTNETKRNE